MSFWTTLQFYRPAAPPALTANDLLSFIEAIDELNISISQGMTLQLKYGESIAKDKEPSFWIEWDEGIGETSEIDWDIDKYNLTISQVKDLLSLENKSIYRAFVSLGQLNSEIVDKISRIGSPENEIDFCPCDLSIEVGPIMLSDPNEGEEFFVGWMSFNIGGNGYLFPWQPDDLIERLNKSPEIGLLKELCRTTWPIADVMPSDKVIQMREKMGKLWTRENVQTPFDWEWGIQESW